MTTLGRMFPLLLLFILTLTALPVTVHADNLLDGKTFVATVDNEKDTLTFADGMFHSSSCDEYGFGKGNYVARQTDNGIAFEAKTTSADNGEMIWAGTIRGDTIKGNYHWTKKIWFWTRSDRKDFTGTLQP